MIRYFNKALKIDSQAILRFVLPLHMVASIALTTTSLSAKQKDSSFSLGALTQLWIRNLK